MSHRQEDRSPSPPPVASPPVANTHAVPPSDSPPPAPPLAGARGQQASWRWPSRSFVCLQLALLTFAVIGMKTTWDYGVAKAKSFLSPVTQASIPESIAVANQSVSPSGELRNDSTNSSRVATPPEDRSTPADLRDPNVTRDESQVAIQDDASENVPAEVPAVVPQADAHLAAIAAEVLDAVQSPTVESTASNPVAVPGTTESVSTTAVAAPVPELQVSCSPFGEVDPGYTLAGSSATTAGGEVCTAEKKTHGTLIEWAGTPDQAAVLAKETGKLLFVIQVSGNFAREEFT
ncbi:MAG TPA: hypothetical protein DCY79_21460 [Planctomycetaceae bacterium]|nr:hypothetical protein [Blastopirellula sp.]HAY82384.1 hypothetical protein [Planctomycetaceae bacterium]